MTADPTPRPTIPYMAVRAGRRRRPGGPRRRRGALRDDGYDVRTTSEGLAALSTVEDETPDVVVLDLRLPDIDGVTVVSRLRPDYQGPILICSGIRDERARIRALYAAPTTSWSSRSAWTSCAPGCARSSAAPRSAAERLASTQAHSPTSTLAERVPEGVRGGAPAHASRSWRIVAALRGAPRPAADLQAPGPAGLRATAAVTRPARPCRPTSAPCGQTLGEQRRAQQALRAHGGRGRLTARWPPTTWPPAAHPDDDTVHELNNVLDRDALRHPSSCAAGWASAGDWRRGRRSLGQELTDRLESLVARASVSPWSCSRRRAPHPCWWPSPRTTLMSSTCWKRCSATAVYSVATTDQRSPTLSLSCRSGVPTSSCCSTSGCPGRIDGMEVLRRLRRRTTSSPHSRSCCSPHTPRHATSRPVSRRGRTPTWSSPSPWRSCSSLLERLTL